MDNLNAATDLYEQQTGFRTQACEDAQASARRAYIVQRTFYHLHHADEFDLDTRLYEEGLLAVFIKISQVSPLDAGLRILKEADAAALRMAIHDADDADEETLMEAL